MPVLRPTVRMSASGVTRPDRWALDRFRRLCETAAEEIGMATRRLIVAMAIGTAATLVVSCGGAVTSSAPSTSLPSGPGAPGVSIGGTVSGLAGTVILQNNGSDTLSISVNGGFTFPTRVASGSSYSFSVSTQPAGQTCTVANGTGTVSGANVTSV